MCLTTVAVVATTVHQFCEVGKSANAFFVDETFHNRSGTHLTAHMFGQLIIVSYVIGKNPDNNAFVHVCFVVALLLSVSRET